MNQGSDWTVSCTTEHYRAGSSRVGGDRDRAGSAFEDGALLTAVTVTCAVPGGSGGCAAYCFAVAPQVHTPAVAGCCIGRARRLLEAAGLLLVVGTEAVADDDLVISQSPSAGSFAPVGGTVGVGVSPQ
jgi:hypothetical protein